MSENKDYYKILGISDEDRKKTGKAFEKVLKKAFRAMAVKYHPDKWVNATEEERADAEAKFKEANEANDVLSDPEKRRVYDLYGTADVRNNRGYGGMSDMDDMMRDFARAHGFDMGYGGNASNMTRKGSDSKVRLRLSVKDIVNNATKTFRYRRYVPCTHCDGSGSTEKNGVTQCNYCGGTGQYVKRTVRGNMFFEQRTTCPNCHGKGTMITNPCQYCGGTGLEESNSEETLTVPAGVADNTVTVIPGGGNFPERNEGIPGDLYIMFVIEDDGEFSSMEGGMYDVLRKVDISVLDFMTGTTFKVKTPYGDEKEITLKPCEKDGKMYRIIGKGLKTENGGSGDMYVKAVMTMPEKLTEEEIGKINSLKESDNFKFLSETGD